MRALKNYSIKTETVEKQITAGRYSPSLELHYGCKKYTLLNCRSEELYFYYESGCIYVLGYHTGLQYVSLTEIDTESNVVNDIFFQNSENIENAFSMTFEDLYRGSPYNVIKLLSQLI